MYPNPASDHVTIAGKNASIVKVTVYDVLGRIMATYSGSNQMMNNDLDVSTLASGSYILAITDAKGNTANKNLIITK